MDASRFFLKKKILAASETSPAVFLCHKYGSYLMASGLPIYRFTPFGYFRRKCVNTVDPPRCKMNETCISKGKYSRYALPLVRDKLSCGTGLVYVTRVV